MSLKFNPLTGRFEFSSGAAGSGTVTSVDLTADPIFTVTGNPIVTSGTINLALSNTQMLKVFAGPVAGGNAPPTFRLLENTDLQSIIGDAVADGVIDLAPTQNAVFDAVQTRLKFVGDWDNLTQYFVNDVVTKEGAGFVCIGSNHSGDPVNNPVLWAPMGTALTQSIVDGDMTHVPSSDAIFDFVTSGIAAAPFWSLDGNAGAGGKFLGTTDAVDVEIRSNNIPKITYHESGGYTVFESIVPQNASGKNFFLHQLNIDPSVSTVGTDYTANYNLVNFDSSNHGDDFAGSINILSPRIQSQGAGRVGGVNVLSPSAFFTNGGTFDSVHMVNADAFLDVGGTITQHFGFSYFLNVQSASVNLGRMLNTSENFASSTIGDLEAHRHDLTISGASSVTGSLTGRYYNANIQDSATLAHQILGSYVGIGFSGTSSVNDSVQGSEINIQFSNDAQMPALSNIYLRNDGVTIKDSADIGGVIGLQQNLFFQDSSTATNIMGANIGLFTSGTTTLQSYTGININPDTQGTTTIPNVNLIGVFGNFKDNTAITNFTGLNISPQFKNSMTLTNLQGQNTNIQIEDTAVITNGARAADFQVSSTPLLSQISGLYVNLSQASLSAAAKAGGAQKMGLSINDGSLQAYYNDTLPSALGFYNLHALGGTVSVAAGDPISALTFAVNYGINVDFQDDWAPDFTGLRVGFVVNAFLSNVGGAAGKTMDSWTGSLAALAQQSGGGHLNQAIMYRAAGVLPQGGTLTVGDVYGFLGMSTLSAASPTNCWGISIEDTNADNNFAKSVSIGTVSRKVTNSDVAFEIGSAKAALLGRMDTAARNALIAVEGMEIYNTSSHQPEYYDGASWASSAPYIEPTWIPEAPTGAVDGANQTFVTTHTPRTSVAVFFNGTFQLPAVGYTIAGDTITTIPTLTAIETIEVYYGY